MEGLPGVTQSFVEVPIEEMLVGIWAQHYVSLQSGYAVEVSREISERLGDGGLLFAGSDRDQSLGDGRSVITVAKGRANAEMVVKKKEEGRKV